MTHREELPSFHSAAMTTLSHPGPATDASQFDGLLVEVLVLAEDREMEETE
jgi:hypothetical protein